VHANDLGDFVCSRSSVAPEAPRATGQPCSSSAPPSAATAVPVIMQEGG
jgi:hypothetical protein